MRYSGKSRRLNNEKKHDWPGIICTQQDDWRSSLRFGAGILAFPASRRIIR
jgi:hypothetical protein